MSNVIVEKTTNANIGNAEFSFNTVIDIFQELPGASLLRELSAKVPMKFSTGQVINVRRNGATNSYETVESLLTVNDNSATPLATGISIEVIQDLHAQYSVDGYDIAAKLLKGIVDKEENASLMTWLNANSLSTPALDLETSVNSTDPQLKQDRGFEISQRVQELVLKMNTPNFRTYEAFCILPFKNAATISSMNSFMGGSAENKDNLVISKIGSTSYYVNQDTTATTAFVGLVEKDTLGASSIILGEYQQEILASTQVESFQQNVGIINRYATAINPLSDTGSEMLMKFEIV